MAYSVGKTSALQTAVKAGVDIALAEYAAAVAAGGPTPSILDRVNEVKDMLKVELFAQVDEDNKAVVSTSGGSYGAGGQRQAGGPVTLDDAKGMVLNFGAFKGMTLGDVLVMTKEEATAYTGGKYSRSGLDYVKWMSTNKDPKGAHSAARAKVVLDDFNRTSADLAKLAG